MPKRLNGKKFNIDAIKDTDLRTYVQNISTSLDRQNQELKIHSLRNDIYQKYFQSVNLKTLLDRLAEGLPIRGYSCLRILVLNQSIGISSQTLIGQSGNEANEYAFLDDQIIQQLDKKKQLIIPDTAKIHSVKFDPKKKFPKTIFATKFLELNDARGFLWTAFEATKDFSEFELELMEIIASSLKEVVGKVIAAESVSRQADLDRQKLDLLEAPILVFEKSQKIIDSNFENNESAQNWVSEINKDTKFIDWSISDTVDMAAKFQIEEKCYQAAIRKIDISGMQAFITVLMDDSIMHARETYLKMVIDTISHDFRAPLINIQGFTKLLSMVGDLNAKQTEYLDSIKGRVENLLIVVEDLADIDRFENEGGLKATECEADEVVESAIALVQAEARQKRIELDVHTGSKGTSIFIDKVMVISAIYNLLKNAFANSRIGGTVEINASLLEGNWTITVKDQGKGISQIDIEKLESNSFISKDQTGLSVVNQIARFHGGKLSLKSELGRGTMFLFEIPVSNIVN